MAGADIAVMRIVPPAIEITGTELGRRLAEMEDEEQGAWLLAFAGVTEEWCWPMQCRNVVDKLTEGERFRIAQCFDTLLDHLRDGGRRTFPQRPILTRLRMPDVDVTVIVNGGIAAWNGTEWCSRMHTAIDDRPITWPVLWWMPFPTDETALDVSERTQPPCGV